MEIGEILNNNWAVTVGGGILVLTIGAVGKKIYRKLFSSPPIEKREEINKKLSELLVLGEESLFNYSIKYKDLISNQKLAMNKITEIRDLAMTYKIGNKKIWGSLLHNIEEVFDKTDMIFHTLPISNIPMLKDVILELSIEDIDNSIQNAIKQSKDTNHDLVDKEITDIASLIETMDVGSNPFLSHTQNSIASLDTLKESFRTVILNFKDSVSKNKHF